MTTDSMSAWASASIHAGQTPAIPSYTTIVEDTALPQVGRQHALSPQLPAKGS
jgi:hypothetical protein